MPIPIHQEKDDELTRNTDLEKCCFCRDRTPWWTSLPSRRGGQQVACCPTCASRGDPKDVPSKTDWCRREQIAHRPTFGEIAHGSDRDYPPAPIVPIKEEDQETKPLNPEHLSYQIAWSDEDQEFVATCPDLPSLSFLDKNQAKALKGIQKLVSEAFGN